eukprot:2021927-Pyramimonas_sp.AAC.1
MAALFQTVGARAPLKSRRTRRQRWRKRRTLRRARRYCVVRSGFRVADYFAGPESQSSGRNLGRFFGGPCWASWPVAAARVVPPPPPQVAACYRSGSRASTPSASPASPPWTPWICTFQSGSWRSAATADGSSGRCPPTAAYPQPTTGGHRRAPGGARPGHPSSTRSWARAGEPSRREGCGRSTSVGGRG